MQVNFHLDILNHVYAKISEKNGSEHFNLTTNSTEDENLTRKAKIRKS